MVKLLCSFLRSDQVQGCLRGTPSSSDDMICHPLYSPFPPPCFFLYCAHALPDKQAVPVYSLPTSSNVADFTSLFSIYDGVALGISASVSSSVKLVALIVRFLGLLSCSCSCKSRLAILIYITPFLLFVMPGSFSSCYLVSVAAVKVQQFAHMPSHPEASLVQLLVETPSPSSTCLNYQRQPSWPATAGP